MKEWAMEEISVWGARVAELWWEAPSHIHSWIAHFEIASKNLVVHFSQSSASIDILAYWNMTYPRTRVAWAIWHFEQLGKLTHDRLISCWHRMEVTQCLAGEPLLLFPPHCACVTGGGLAWQLDEPGKSVRARGKTWKSLRAAVNPSAVCWRVNSVCICLTFLSFWSWLQIEGIHLIECKWSLAIFAPRFPSSTPSIRLESNLDATEGKFGSQERNVYPFAGFCSLFLQEGTKYLQTPRLPKVNKLRFSPSLLRKLFIYLPHGNSDHWALNECRRGVCFSGITWYNPKQCCKK